MRRLCRQWTLAKFLARRPPAAVIKCHADEALVRGSALSQAVLAGVAVPALTWQGATVHLPACHRAARPSEQEAVKRERGRLHSASRVAVLSARLAYALQVEVLARFARGE